MVPEPPSIVPAILSETPLSKYASNLTSIEPLEKGGDNKISMGKYSSPLSPK